MGFPVHKTFFKPFFFKNISVFLSLTKTRPAKDLSQILSIKL